MDSSASQFCGCGKVTLQAEVSARHVSAFSERYSGLVGRRPSGESFIPTENRETHKAPILSVFFSGASAFAVGNLRAMGFAVSEFQKGEFGHAVVGEKLFWTLIRNGYRIGSQAGIKPPVVAKVAAPASPVAAQEAQVELALV